MAEYLVDLNATQAAIRAGYSKKSAARIGVELLNKTQVSDAIQKAREQQTKRTLITADYVLSSLREVVERSMQRAPVCNMRGEQIIDDEGNHIWGFDAKNANRALELLGKHLGLWTDKVQTEVSGGLSIKWSE